MRPTRLALLSRISGVVACAAYFACAVAATALAQLRDNSERCGWWLIAGVSVIGLLIAAAETQWSGAGGGGESKRQRD
jgi:hypothetical protein